MENYPTYFFILIWNNRKDDRSHKYNIRSRKKELQQLPTKNKNIIMKRNYISFAINCVNNNDTENDDMVILELYNILTNLYKPSDIYICTSDYYKWNTKIIYKKCLPFFNNITNNINIKLFNNNKIFNRNYVKFNQTRRQRNKYI